MEPPTFKILQISIVKFIARSQSMYATTTSIWTEIAQNSNVSIYLMKTPCDNNEPHNPHSI